MKIRIHPRWLARLVAAYIRLLYATLRVRHMGLENITRYDDPPSPYIVAFWHGHLLLMVFGRHRKPMQVMISHHRDGELIARTMELFGIDVARGSTTRGGSAALRAMLRVTGSGTNLAFTPDGPRGPRRVLQPGVIAAAQMTGLPVIPVVVSAARKRVLRSWDRMEIPRPFSRYLYVYGEPMIIARDADFEGERVRVERALNDLAESTDAAFDSLWSQAVR
jgi:lysophospholipid acyltransferase (LPLAT)-like uncharacterized protein